MMAVLRYSLPEESDGVDVDELCDVQGSKSKKEELGGFSTELVLGQLAVEQ